MDLPAEVIGKYDWKGRSIKTHRQEIRERLGFRPATLNDQKAIRSWLIADVLPQEYRPAYLEQLIYQRLRRDHIEPPTKNRLERLILSAIHRHEKRFFAKTYARLTPSVRASLGQLIVQVAELADDVALEGEDDNPQAYPLHELKTGAGEPRVTNIKKVAARLKLLQEVGLPSNLFTDIGVNT